MQEFGFGVADDPSAIELPDLKSAESILTNLAEVFFQRQPNGARPEASACVSEPTLEARYKVLLDQIPAVVFMAYLDQGIGEAYVSPQIEETLGFSQKEWLEDPVVWYNQVHPDDKNRWCIEAAEMFLSGKSLRSAYRVLARDGRVVWFHCEARLVRRADGQPWFIHGVGIDITELKRTQEELQEERNVVSAIFETVGALVVVLDREGRIVRFNRACRQLSGYSLDESKGAFIWDRFIDPFEAPAFRNLFFEIRENVSRAEHESNWISRDGRQRIIAWSAAILPSTKHTPSYIILSGIDVTEQRRADAKFRALLDAAPDAVVVANQSGRIVLVNAQVEKLFGYDRHELLGAEIEILVPPRLRGRHPGRRRGFLSDPHVRPMGAGMELHALHKDGHEFPVEISLSPLETEDGLLVSSAIRDISERKRLEKAILEIRDAEQRRIGQDLHDGLGQHLTGVAFLGKVLEERLAESSEADAAAGAAKIVKLVNESIKMTRDLARGLLPVVSEAHGLMSALRHWAMEASELFHTNCVFECSAPVVIRDGTVADHLYRLAQEAATNALKHGHARNITIGLAVVMGGGVLTIRDDGCGFELTRQSPGLGLRIMSYRAKMISGALSVESSPGRGTAVKCMFPIGI